MQLVDDAIVGARVREARGNGRLRVAPSPNRNAGGGSGDGVAPICGNRQLSRHMATLGQLQADAGGARAPRWSPVRWQATAN